MGIWLGLHWVLFYFFDHYIISGEVIGFRLFRATGLAFAIRIFKVQFNHIASPVQFSPPLADGKASLARPTSFSSVRCVGLQTTELQFNLSLRVVDMYWQDKKYTGILEVYRGGWRNLHRCCLSVLQWNSTPLLSSSFRRRPAKGVTVSCVGPCLWELVGTF